MKNKRISVEFDYKLEPHIANVFIIEDDGYDEIEFEVLEIICDGRNITDECKGREYEDMELIIYEKLKDKNEWKFETT